ncbi:MAG: hypothetical protein M1133_07165, partial [Armatimonadetes bacterium]|nr:hypothetical protein [Armatimonadota bacterium]
SLEWMQIRANILNKRIVRPAVTECAMGAAVGAASKTVFHSVEAAVASMVRIADECEPSPAKASVYDELYGNFRETCSKFGYC